MKQRFSKRTRLVSALLTLAMVFTFLPFSAFAATDSYGPVYITDANVPDKTFREYLLKRFDKDGNGVLTPAERYAATEIDVENKYISNLSGIQFFPNLKVLNCGHNRLTKLDVSENTVLQELVCWENQLTSLDVSQNTALQELACFENQLTSLDVSQNPALQKLSCWDNRLTSLDVSKNTELTYLKCSYNRLTELDVSKNTELTYLDCGYNRLTELDVSQNTKLTELYFVSNKITSLQADNCTNLTVIFTGSNKYKVEVYKKTRILDPSILPGNFDISRVRNLKGATQNADGTLTVQEGGGKVTYEYRCVGEIYKPFTLNVTETDDPNAGIVPPVTPPSGGGDSIAINASNFPDPDFRTYVKAEFDKDNNNSLSESERKTVTVINVKDKLIETLEGIEFFPNLKELDCSINQLSRLDVSQNTALEKLDCSTNQLASLNLSKNAKLKYLYCSQNELTSLDVSQTAVTTLNASDNKIDIDVEETPRTFDLSTLPGKFDVTKATNWSGGTVSGKTLKVNEGTNQVTYTYACGKGRSETFTLNVKVVPDGTVTPPSGGDTPGGTTPGGSTGGGDGGGAVVIVAAVGAVAAGVVGYGVYNYVSGRKLQALLPEGVAAPENRAQTALLLWNTAGRPEPADAPAFADVADPDTAKAAQWCVEQGLMKRRLNGKFAPGSSIPAYQVLNAYRKLAG
ncbi:hypothetical protein C7K05_11615 [Faecalibacterium prausnitzii]